MDAKIRQRLIARFGEALRRARGSRTQEWLAAQSGVTVQSIARYEKGLRPAPWPEALALARATGLSLDDLQA